LGATGLNIATRIMGLLLAAIAVGFITDGLAALLPGMAR
jgi:multiple antibiotic resistance protein